MSTKREHVKARISVDNKILKLMKELTGTRFRIELKDDLRYGEIDFDITDNQIKKEEMNKDFVNIAEN